MSEVLSFKDFLKTLVVRFQALCIKMIGVKSLFAIGSTILYLRNTTSQPAMMLCGFAWLVLIGGREFEKALEKWSPK